MPGRYIYAPFVMNFGVDFDENIVKQYVFEVCYPLSLLKRSICLRHI